MRQLIPTLCFLLLSCTAFCQQEENGIIYIKHPYIDAVNKAQKAYVDKDAASMKTFYSDTAKWWASGLAKQVPIADAIKIWFSDFDNFDSISQKPFGYPDYLHYKDGDAKVVQSWWLLSGKSKKTGKVVKVRFEMLDDFNNDGKIVMEQIFGDFSEWSAEGSSTDDEKALRQLIQELTTALGKNDATELDRIYAPGFVFVPDDGKPVTKTERLAAFRSGKMKYQTVSIKVNDLKLYGTTAVGILDINATGTMDGKQMGGHFVTIVTFIKNNGRWVEVAAASMRMAK